MAGSRFAGLIPNDNMYVIPTAADLPQQVDRWRIYHLLYDPGAGAGLYYSPDAINLVRLASGGATIPAGTVDNSILRWDSGGGVWVEFTSFILPLADGAADQIMQTDGAGVVTWIDIPAGVDPGTVVSSTLRWDGADWVENVDVRSLADLIFSGTTAGDILRLAGRSGSPDVGRIHSESPIEILYDTIGNTTPVEQYAMRWRPTFTATGSYIGGFLNVAPVVTISTAVFIPATFSDSSSMLTALAPGFSAFTFINELAVIENLGNFNLMSALVINVGLTHERNSAGTSTTGGATGMNFSPQTRTTIAGAVLTKTTQTAINVAPTYSTVAGSTANLGVIRGVHMRNPTNALFQPGAGVETMGGLFGVDMDNITFGGVATRAAVRSAMSAGTGKYFLLNTSNALSEFGGSWAHFNDGFGVQFGDTPVSILHYWDGVEGALRWNNAFGSGAESLYLEPDATDVWRWHHADAGTADIGMQFDVNAISFGTTAPTPNSNNWFTIYSAPSLRVPNIGGEYADILYSAAGALDIDGNAMSEVASLKVNTLAVLLSGGSITDLSNVRIASMPSFGADNVQALWMTGRFRLDGTLAYGSESPAQLTGNQDDWNLAPNNAMRTMVLMDSDGAYNVTGIESSFGFAQNGDVRTIFNTSAFTMTFTNEDVNSLAANRFQNANNGPITIAPQGSVTYRYEDSVSRWQQLYLTGTYLEEADADLLYLRLDTTNDPLTNNLDGVSFNSVALTAAGAATNFLNEAGAYSLPDHTAIANIGVNTHAAIDLHIADLDIHFSDAPADGSPYERIDNGWQIAGTSGSSLVAAYRFQTSTTEADPGNGNLRYDNATPASVTELYISYTTDNNVDLTNILSFVAAGDRIYVQQDNDSSKYLLFDVDVNVDNTTWTSLEGSVFASGTIPDSNSKCHILILFGAAAGTVVTSFEGRSGTVTALQADYDAFFLTQAEGDALYQPLGTYVTSITGGTNINVGGTATVPIVNLDAALVGVSVNGVTLSNAGAATAYLDETGNYSVPAGSGGAVDSVTGGTNINVTGTGADPIVNLDAAITGVSVNGVTLSAAGAATNYLDETGAYSVPPDTIVTSLPAGSITAGNLISTVLLFETAVATNSAFKIPFLNTTGNVSGNFEVQFDDGASSFTYNPSTNIFSVGSVAATTVSATLVNGIALTTGGVATNYLDETGNYSVPAGAGGGIGGSITDNQVAVGATVANDIEGFATLLFDTSITTLHIGSSSVRGSLDLHDQGRIFFRSNGDADNASIQYLSDFIVDADVTTLRLASNDQIDLVVDNGQAIQFRDGVGTGNWVWDNATRLSWDQDLRLDDNNRMNFGDAADAFMYWNGSIMVCDVLSTGNWSFESPLVVRSGNAQSWFDATNNDRVTFTNDGTDLVVTEVGMDAVRFSSINLEMGDDDEFRLGNSDDVEMHWNSATSEFQINLLSTTAEFELRIGGAQAIRSVGEGGTALGYDGVYPFSTQEYFGSGNTSGATVLAHSAHGLDVGFNVIRVLNDNVSDTLEASHCGQMAFKDAATARTLTLASNVDLDFPVSGMTTVVNAFTSGNYTITEGASTTLYYLDGTTRVDTAGGCTIGPGGVANIWRESATVYYIWGTGITP